MSSILGRVVATERRPNTPHEFHFWTALDSPVGIGTIVRVDGRDAVNGVLPQVYGIVTEGFSWTDLASPLHDVMGFDGSPDGESLHQTSRAEIRLYTAAVLRHVPEEPLQPVPMGTVFLAEEADVAIACGWTATSRRVRTRGSRSVSTAPAAPTRRSISTPTFSSGPR